MTGQTRLKGDAQPRTYHSAQHRKPPPPPLPRASLSHAEARPDTHPSTLIASIPNRIYNPTNEQEYMKPDPDHLKDDGPAICSVNAHHLVQPLTSTTPITPPCGETSEKPPASIKTPASILSESFFVFPGILRHTCLVGKGRTSPSATSISCLPNTPYFSWHDDGQECVCRFEGDEESKLMTYMGTLRKGESQELMVDTLLAHVKGLRLDLRVERMGNARGPQPRWVILVVTLDPVWTVQTNVISTPSSTDLLSPCPTEEKCKDALLLLLQNQLDHIKNKADEISATDLCRRMEEIMAYTSSQLGKVKQCAKFKQC